MRSVHQINISNKLQKTQEILLFRYLIIQAIGFDFEIVFYCDVTTIYQKRGTIKIFLVYYKLKTLLKFFAQRLDTFPEFL